MIRARRAEGFTLIELLVAITLASLVAVLGAVVLRAALDFHGRANRYLKASEDLRAADRLLAREWSRRRDAGLVATANRLEFQTDRLYGAGTEGAARVLYLCRESDAGEVALERRLLARAAPERPGSATPADASTQWRVLQADVLVPHLIECGFAYLQPLQPRDPRDPKIAQWRAAAEAGQPVPRLLRVRLATQRGELAPLVYAADG